MSFQEIPTPELILNRIHAATLLAAAATATVQANRHTTDVNVGEHLTDIRLSADEEQALQEALNIPIESATPRELMIRPPSVVDKPAQKLNKTTTSARL